MYIFPASVKTQLQPEPTNCSPEVHRAWVESEDEYFSALCINYGKAHFQHHYGWHNLSDWDSVVFHVSDV